MDRAGNRRSAILAVEIGAEADSTPSPAIPGLVARALADHDGRLLREAGTIRCLSFPSAEDAVSCALDLKATLAELPLKSERHGAFFRAGVIALPEETGSGGNRPGAWIEAAVRVSAIARPSRICITGDAFRDLDGERQRTFRDIGLVDAGGELGELRCYETKPDAAPGKRTTAPAGSGGSEAEIAEEAVAELKSIISKYAKRAGSRISSDAVKRFMPQRGPEVDRAIDRLADLGYLRKGGAEGGGQSWKSRSGRADWSRDWREEWSATGKEQAREIRREVRDRLREEHRERHHNHHDDLEPDTASTFARYRKRVIAKGEKAIAGLVPHVVTYLMVNGALLFLNMTTSPHFPWFLFPAGGWAIGLISHFAAVAEARRRKREVEALPEDLSEEDAKLVRKYHRARGGARSSFFALVSVSLFLGLINAITSPAFPWAVIPAAGMFIGIVSSYASYLPVRGAFRRRRKALMSGHVTSAPTGFESAEGDDPIVRRAIQLARSVLEQSRSLGGEHAALGEDLEPLLGSYVGRIRMLTSKSREVSTILSAIPKRELENDLSLLKRRNESSESPSLREEYRKSIDAIERQNRSLDALQSQRELLDLKVTSSLTSLQQMQMDLARMEGISTVAEGDAALKNKAQELSQYIDDLESSYQEIEQVSGTGERARLSADELLRELKESESKKGGDRGRV